MISSCCYYRLLVYFFYSFVGSLESTNFVLCVDFGVFEILIVFVDFVDSICFVGLLDVMDSLISLLNGNCGDTCWGSPPEIK